MKVIGIAGSPRVQGSSTRLVEKALEGSRQAGSETVLHHLGSLSYSGCRACYACRKDGTCIQKDDMQAIYDDLRNCTAVVIGSPVYMYSPTSLIKAFTDRLFALIGPGFESRLGRGVPLLTIYTQGADNPALFQPSFDSLEGALDMVGLHPAGRIVGESLGEPVDLESRPALLESAFEAGRRLVSG